MEWVAITKCINQCIGPSIFSYGSNCYEKENPSPLILPAAVIIMISLFSLTMAVVSPGFVSYFLLATAASNSLPLQLVYLKLEGY